MLHLYLKAFHIIGFVSWFAGLFYLVRLFVYHTEAFDKSEPERSILIQQFNTMEWRLYKIITNPAMMITFICGIGMLINTPAFLEQGWMQIKLVLLILLLIYHLYCKKIIIRLEKGEKWMTSFQFRLFNELPTLFLVSIVLLAVAKSLLNVAYAFLGVLLFGLILFAAAKMYKRSREK